MYKYLFKKYSKTKYTSKFLDNFLTRKQHKIKKIQPGKQFQSHSIIVDKQYTSFLLYTWFKFTFTLSKFKRIPQKFTTSRKAHCIYLIIQ